MNEGHYIDQYNNLASYCKELSRSNSRSTVVIKTQMDGLVRRFHKMYICFAACKEGWIKGCRSLIGLDGCHIKGHHPVIEVENQEAWTWFLEYLKVDLKIERDNSYTFITDKQKGLGNAIAKHFSRIDKIGQRVTCYRAHRSGEFIFKVTGSGDMGSKHAVDLGLHTCTCKRWQISGIPCVHAICAIRFKKQKASLYCDDYLMPNMYKEAYTPIIYPIAGEDDWDQVDYPIAPPPYKKQAGRPKMKRHKEPGENNTTPPAPKEEKLSKKGIKMSCKICGQQGHNKLGCAITKAKKANTVKRAPAPKATNVMDQVISWREKKDDLVGLAGIRVDKILVWRENENQG
ncbi:hypothetical protein ACLB2K_035579 [Fragaria x ananassa]